MDELEPGGVIATDIPCVACGFSLEGLRNQGRCPECGKPIRSSTRPSRICTRRTEWWDRAIHSVVIVAGFASPILLCFGWVLNQPRLLQVCVGTASLAFNVAVIGVCISYFVRHSWLIRFAVLTALVSGALVLAA